MKPHKRHLVIQTNVVTESFIAPNCVVIRATRAFAKELSRLRKICIANSLDSARVAYAPDKWLPERVAAELRMSTPSMVVTASSF